MARAKKSSRSVSRASGTASSSMSSCTDCGGKWVGWVVLVAGVLWLLNDYGSAPWWQVSWWTLGALVLGLGWVLKK